MNKQLFKDFDIALDALLDYLSEEKKKIRRNKEKDGKRKKK